MAKKRKRAQTLPNGDGLLKWSLEAVLQQKKIYTVHNLITFLLLSQIKMGGRSIKPLLYSNLLYILDQDCLYNVYTVVP